jgi:hypothetical protein
VTHTALLELLQSLDSLKSLLDIMKSLHLFETVFVNPFASVAP